MCTVAQLAFIKLGEENEGTVITNGSFVFYEKWAFSFTAPWEKANDLLIFPQTARWGKTDSGQGDAINFRKWKRTFQQTFNLVYDF